jgi:hypothetical protein
VYPGVVRSIVVAAFLGCAVLAQAQPRQAEKAEADRLFEEGRKLLAEGKREEACSAFEQSIRKDPRAVGTLLNLGLCNEQSGKPATAVRYYAEARSAAHDQQLKEHEEAAARKLALLSPRVPHLTINGAPPDGRVILDNLVLSAQDLGDVIADPGERTILVTAPGKLPYEQKVTLEEGKPTMITIPPLSGAKTVVVRANRRRQWGKILTVSGAGLTVGAFVAGYFAERQYWDQFPDASRDGKPARDAAHDCWTTMTTRECNTAGASKVDSARTLAHVSTGVAVTGGLAIGAGLILWLTSPKRDEMQVTATVSGDGAGFAVVGRF